MTTSLFLALALSVTAVDNAPDKVSVDVSSERNQALLVLGAGVGLGIVSTTAFIAGFDAERELRASKHDEASADDILNRRTVAAWVAWPSAVLAAAGVATGVALLAMQGTGEDGGGAP